MTSLDPTHLPDLGWKTQPRTRGEAVHEIPRAGALPIRALPDLRFEQSYLLSLKPFVHLRAQEASNSETPGGRGTIEKPAAEDAALAEPLTLDIAVQGAGVSKYGVPERVEWGKIAWVTTRDQVSLFRTAVLRGMTGSCRLYHRFSKGRYGELHQYS
jgi:hypothetical protein